ncbi:LOW QUALITY PROTEIN: hypothetical protein SETIT_1G204300v2 [Setaria italica]|uniref:Uncharacterized protein n=2 Tax=Setaria italica TaxID=4555 RepID=A0A368PMD8_SETIT|nr:LOW QUALITY PROTEIN: hypothetical protein SETIT_1G204300v2 [Setaria italica]
MDVDMWASLPPELLVDIFRRLEAAAALRCTGVCKPWRRAIAGNAASCLRPRPDCRDRRRQHGALRTRSPAVSSFAQLGAATDLASYDELLASRDGLVLLGGRAVQDLCLWSLMTGDRKLLPAGAFKDAYVLLTGYDLTVSDGGGGGDDDDDLKAVILAVKEKGIEGGMTYQIFSTSDGAWGAVTVTRSHRFKKGLVTRIYPGSEVICRGGAVHWLGMATDAGVVECAVAVDVRSRRTWLTDLPEGCGKLDCYSSLRTSPLRLATSGDGRLTVVRSFGGGLVEVWVLTGGDRWVLRRTIDVRNLLPYCHGDVWFSACCPRSGCLLGHVGGKELLVCCLIECVDTNHGGCMYSLEMDWSTYMAKMKRF